MSNGVFAGLMAAWASGALLVTSIFAFTSKGDVASGVGLAVFSVVTAGLSAWLASDED